MFGTATASRRGPTGGLGAAAPVRAASGARAPAYNLPTTALSLSRTEKKSLGSQTVFMPIPRSRASAALRTPPPSADSAPGGEVPKNVLKAAADGRVGPVRQWLNDGGKADTLFELTLRSAAVRFHAPC